MENNIKIRKFKKADLYDSAVLISKTFAQFNNDGSKEGVEWYVAFFDPNKNGIENIEKIFARADINFVAVDGEKIVGILRGRKSRLVNLFVDGNYHRQGIANKLFEKFEAENTKQGVDFIKINSSSYAVPFYQKMGCKKTTGMRKFRGLNIQPMKKVFKKVAI